MLLMIPASPLPGASLSADEDRREIKPPLPKQSQELMAQHFCRETDA
jgi:hypothetical protein